MSSDPKRFFGTVDAEKPSATGGFPHVISGR
jgi:hypothetical protein